MVSSKLTIPEAIRKLFNIDVAKESPLLKNKAHSLVRNGLIKVETEQIVQRKAVYLADGQLTVLHNALLLNAIFPDPKEVKKIFEDRCFRNVCAETLAAMFSGQSSLAGIALRSPETIKLVGSLAGDFNLYEENLPNPFPILPQVAMGKNTNLLHALLAQSASLAPADSLLLAFLNGNLVDAEQLASQLHSTDPSVLTLQKAINSRLNDARDFDDLLDQFRNM